MKTRTRGFSRTIHFSLAELVVLVVNILLAGKLYSVEYSNQLGSIEGTFIAIARQMTLHPRDLLWWPLWDCGLPFQNTYLPLMHLFTAVWSSFSGISAALAYHRVAALFFCLGPMTLLLMAFVITRRVGASFAAALAYSIISPSALITPDLGSVLRLRRLQFLVMWGEGPETTALALFPVAVLFLYLAFRERRFLWKALAGLFMGLTVLTNAFGGTILAMAAIALLASVEIQKFWRNLGMTVVIAGLAWCAISPMFPPSVLAAMRVNSPTVEGDYRFTVHSLIGCLILAAMFGGAWFLSRKAEEHLRFFALFTLLVGGVAILGYLGHMYVLPQPNRYEQVMDLGICLTAAFALPRRMPKAVLIVLLCLAAIQTRQQVRFARGLIRSADIKQTAMWRGIQWIDKNLHGQRVMVAGPYSYYVNDFTEIPQLHGGHDPMLPNPSIRDVVAAIYAGNISIPTLQAYGVHALFVSRPMEGLPVLWREGADVIYGVPDVEDPPIEWTSRHTAIVYVNQPVIPLKITYTPGWRVSKGTIYKDERGLMTLEAGCSSCTVALTYDGGWELAATMAASSLVISITIMIGLVRAFHWDADVFGLFRR